MLAGDAPGRADWHGADQAREWTGVRLGRMSYNALRLCALLVLHLLALTPTCNSVATTGGVPVLLAERHCATLCWRT